MIVKKSLKMSTIFDILLTIFLFITCFHALTASNIIKNDETDKAHCERKQALWFGPRLGKRSFQLVDDENSQAILKLLEAADAVKYYYNQMQDEMQADEPQPKVTKKVIFTPKLGRAADIQERMYDNVEFTPRLGRKLPEKMPLTPAEEERYSNGQDPVKTNLLMNHLMPRLGRNYNFSPRLGRDLIYDLYAEPQVRVARSVNKTKSTQF